MSKKKTLASQIETIVKKAESGKPLSRTRRRRNEVDYKNPDPSHLHKFESEYQKTDTFPASKRSSRRKAKKTGNKSKKLAQQKKKQKKKKKEINPIDDYAKPTRLNREERAIEKLKARKRKHIGPRSKKMSLSEQFNKIIQTTEKREKSRSRSRSKSPSRGSPKKKAKTTKTSKKARSRSRSKSPTRASPKRKTKTSKKRKSTPKKKGTK